MPACAMYGCKSYSRKTRGTDIRYYKFPKQEDLKNKWLVACGRIDTNINLKNACVCSLHFDENCFHVQLKHKLLKYTPKNNRDLKSDAVPNPYKAQKNNLDTPEELDFKVTDTMSNGISCGNLETILDTSQNLLEPKIEMCEEEDTVSSFENEGLVTKNNLPAIQKCKTRRSYDTLIEMVKSKNKVSTEILMRKKWKHQIKIEKSTSEEIKLPLGVKTKEARKSYDVLIEMMKNKNEFTNILTNQTLNENSEIVTNKSKEQEETIEALKNRISELEEENSQLLAELDHIVDEKNEAVVAIKSEMKILVPQEIRRILEVCFTPGQIKALLSPRRKVYWSPEDIEAANSLRKISQSAYSYLRENNYPLPALSTLRSYFPAKETDDLASDGSNIN